MSRLKTIVPFIYTNIFLLLTTIGFAQEHTGPLLYNANMIQAKNNLPHAALKTTSQSLPFFEDFTGYNIFPDSNKWVPGQGVYVNNTMCLNPVSRGVVTLDALNQIGIPYDSNDNAHFQYADSLTVKPIDLSAHQPGDSIYMSFFYQPQGNGFFPVTKDSLLLYFRKSFGEWALVWSAPGTALQPFQQVLVPVADTDYFYNAFQFRFVNIAALMYADANWNIDYIRMDANRNLYDTSISDVCFASDLTPLLSDYTSMPYRQFMANTAVERASQFSDSIKNNYPGSQIANLTFIARESISGTPLFSTALGAQTIASGMQPIAFPTYSNTVSQGGLYDKVIFENKIYMQSISSVDPQGNDTIVKEQVFDNYLAYDDGTAEKSYYLTQFSSLPAYLAIEFHLNIADTLRGLAIYFGRQAPNPVNKFFSIIVYNSLNGVNGGGSDNILYKKDNLLPAYTDTINHFWIYKFPDPLPLPAGKFYAGTMQPAFGGSDSLYFGLDVNRSGSNHAYYNVNTIWKSSQVQGAVMIRPLLGQPIQGTRVPVVNIFAEEKWSFYPNPSSTEISFHYNSDRQVSYRVSDIQGRSLLQGIVNNNYKANISVLSAGIYFVTLYFDGIPATTQKLIKQ